MVKIEFWLDKEVDSRNWSSVINPKDWHYSFNNNFAKNVPSNMIKLLKNKTQKEVADILDPKLDKLYQAQNFQKIATELTQWRDENGEPLFNRMEKFVWHPLPMDNLWVKLTTAPRYPYFIKGGWAPNSLKDWGFLFGPLYRVRIKEGLFHKQILSWEKFDYINRSINTALHEILHMMTHYYYEDYIRSQWLSRNEFQDLKEAQTVILNQEYKDILQRPDRGYDDHKDIREKFASFWEKNQNFDEFVDYGIKVMKERRKTKPPTDLVK